MTATDTPIATLTERVRPGTAEQLARLAHFASLDLPEIDELDDVAHFLLGDVGDREKRRNLWRQLKEGDAGRLWHLISDDWDDRDLDELEGREYEHVFSVETERDLRYENTRNRLVADIERVVWLWRFAAAEARRAERRRLEYEALTESPRRLHPTGGAR